MIEQKLAAKKSLLENTQIRSSAFLSRPEHCSIIIFLFQIERMRS